MRAFLEKAKYGTTYRTIVVLINLDIKEFAILITLTLDQAGSPSKHSYGI